MRASDEHDLARLDAVEGYDGDIVAVGGTVVARGQDRDAVTGCDEFEFVLETRVPQP